MLLSTADDALVERLRTGDEAASEEFCARFRSRLEFTARRWGVTHADARDLAQETLSSAVLQIQSGRFRGDASLGTWLWSILRNLLVNHQEGRRRQGLQVALEDVRQRDTLVRASQEVSLAVRETLALLPRLHRVVLWQNLAERRTTEEIARRLRRPVGTIGKVLWQAKAQFADLYGREEFHPRRRLSGSEEE